VLLADGQCPVKVLVVPYVAVELEEHDALDGAGFDVAQTSLEVLAPRRFHLANDQIRELVRGYEAAGVDQLVFVSQAGRNRHEHICESLELFAREVMPEFAERADDHERAKLDRLAPAIQAALARRDPPREAPAGYSFPALPQA
jgi:hypothetical protein